LSSSLHCVSFCTFFFYGYGDHRDLPSFPTRRSSDLASASLVAAVDAVAGLLAAGAAGSSSKRALAHASTSVTINSKETEPAAPADRKSTRLNSSHSQISYAVFCLKKKKKEKQQQ